MEKLKKILKIKQEEISKSSFQDKKELDILKTICSSLKINDLESIYNVANSDFLFALMRTFDSSKNLEVQYEISKSLSVDLNTLTEDQKNLLDSACSIVDDVINYGCFNELMQFLANEDLGILKAIRVSKEFIKSIKNEQLKKDISIFLSILPHVFSTPENSRLFCHIINDFYNTDLLKGFWAFLDYETYYDILFAENADSDYSFSRDGKRMLKKKLEKSLLKESNIKLYIDLINAYQEKLEKSYDEHENTKKRNIFNLKKLETLYVLKSSQPNMKIDADFEKILNQDEEIKYLVLSMILKHNAASYEKLKQENNLNPYNSITELEKLFVKFNQNIELLSKENQVNLLKYQTIEELNSILTILSNNKFNFIQITAPFFIDILLYTTPTILNTINTYISNGFITIDFFKKKYGDPYSKSSRRNKKYP